MLEPVIHGEQGLRVEMIEAVAAGAVFADEAGAAKQAEMFGDGGAGYGEGAGNFAGGLIAAAKEVKHGAAGGVGEGAEDEVGGMSNHTVSHNL